jgi:16S rRNA processing protein RimM
MTKRAGKSAGNNTEAERVLLGRINAAQGLRGEVRVTSFTESPESLGAYGPLTDQKGRGFTIEAIRVIKGSLLAVRLADVPDRAAAEALKGTELYVEKSRLPAVDENEWYYQDLVGLRAEDEAGAAIGEVIAVQNYGAGDLIEIRLGDSRQTTFVPFTETAVPKVDIAAGRIVVVLPEFEDPAD